MAEQDVFEGRLRAALLRHVADGPTEFDALEFARAVAASEPRRRGLRGALGALAWPGVAIPRVVWVLVLLALLTALVGGTVLVGSLLHRRLPAVIPPIGEVFTCPVGSTPDEPGPADQARPVIGEGLAAMVFDRRNGRIVLLAQVLSGAETWTFDVCTNTWARMHPAQEPGSPLGEATSTIYDIDSNVTIAIDGESTWVYDLPADTWTRMATTPAVRQWNTLTWTYDPVTGLVIAADADKLWSYDVETDAWASISTVPWPAGGGAITYDASVDRIVAYARPELWLFDLGGGRWIKSGADAPVVICGMGWPNPSVVYDVVAERTIVACNITVAYDATEDRWESPGGDVSPFALYDEVNKRFVGLEADVLLAFDPATHERTPLVKGR